MYRKSSAFGDLLQSCFSFPEMGVIWQENESPFVPLVSVGSLTGKDTLSSLDSVKVLCAR